MYDECRDRNAFGRSTNAEVWAQVVTIRPENIDTGVVGMGMASAVWNFVLGDLNILLGTGVAFFSLVVLWQRFLINRRELRKDDEHQDQRDQ